MSCKILYIGDTPNGRVYYNITTDEVLIDRKNILKKKRTLKDFVKVLLQLLLYIIILFLIAFFFMSFGRYPQNTHKYVLIFWAVEAILLEISASIQNRKSLHRTVNGTKKDLEEAMYTNKIFKDASNKVIQTSDIRKKAVFNVFMIAFLVFVIIAPLFLIKDELIGQSIGLEVILFLFGGFFIYALLALLFYNREVRFLEFVKKYQENHIYREEVILYDGTTESVEVKNMTRKENWIGHLYFMVEMALTYFLYKLLRLNPTSPFVFIISMISLLLLSIFITHFTTYLIRRIINRKYRKEIHDILIKYSKHNDDEVLYNELRNIKNKPKFKSYINKYHIDIAFVLARLGRKEEAFAEIDQFVKESEYSIANVKHKIEKM